MSDYYYYYESRFDSNNNRILQKVDKVETKIAMFRPHRAQIARTLHHIADKVEEAQRGTSAAKATGAAVGIIGAIAGVVGGGLLIAATGGAATPIVLGVGVGAGVLGGATGAVASVANTIVKSQRFKEMEKVIRQDKEFYATVQDEVNTIKEIMNENESLLFKMAKFVRDGLKIVWDKVKDKVERLMIEIAKKVDIEKLKAVWGSVYGGGKLVVDTVRHTAEHLVTSAGKIVGSATVVLSLFAIGCEIYNMVSGIEDFTKNEDVRKIRELAIMMENFDGAHKT